VPAPYIGRFAPSPTGPLHAGSLVAALASYLDAQTHHGRWLLRIEDLDGARTVPDAAQAIIQTLERLGMRADGDIVWQSQRTPLYEAAFAQLAAQSYPCACSRKEIADSRTGFAADGAAIYPGTCRTAPTGGRTARAWRVRVPEPGNAAGRLCFTDRWQGEIGEDLGQAVGDFVLKRADGVWAYQLAVVADDAAQGVTHIVRGADLLDSTARQMYLQRLLGLPTPDYLHVPVVVNEQGEKLSKQTGAEPVDSSRPLYALLQAARQLGLSLDGVTTPASFWEKALPMWAQRFGQIRSG